MKSGMIPVLLTVLSTGMVFAQTVGAKTQEKNSVLQKTKRTDHANAVDKLLTGIIIDLEKKEWEAAKRKDKYALADLMAEDYTEVNEFGRRNKKETLESVENLTLADYAITDIAVARIDKYVTIMRYRIKSKGVYRNRAFASDDYAASFWVRRGEKWLRVYCQETPASAN